MALLHRAIGIVVISHTRLLTIRTSVRSGPDGLISWWPAEGNANDVINTNNGVLKNGATYGLGEVGQAFSLSGGGQYVSVADDPSLRPTNLTAEGWFNLQAGDGVRVLVAKPYGTGTWDSFAVWVENGTLVAAVTTASVQQPVVSYSWLPIFGTWHHVAYTFDSQASLQTLYVDGATVASNSASGPIAYDTHPFQIGADIENGTPSFFFDGLIDEVSLFNRALSSSEIAGIFAAGVSGKCPLAKVVTIVAQPESQSAAIGATVNFSVTAGGTPAFAYQWSFDGTNIAGATSATLVLTDVNISDSGSYMVAVTNAFGSTNSSNAVLAVGYPPSMTVFPQSQDVVQGTNVTFTANATGTGPLSYQWSFDGTALENATNSALSFSNVEYTNAGSYAVTVSSPFGAAASSNAVLTVVLLPEIGTQPQNESVITGKNVTFSVSLFPSVTSGTMQLWLKADAGVITNGSGQVLEWQDQSANSNSASQPNTNLLPSLVYPSGLAGRAAVRFNGIQDGIHGQYLTGTGNVNVPNAMTAFVVYNAINTATEFSSVWFIGAPGTYGGGRGYTISEGLMDFTTWAYDNATPWSVPTNTYRICTDRVDTNLSTVQLFDNSASADTNFSYAMSGSPVAPAAGYYVGGMITSYGYGGYSFAGDIAELMFYSGYLTDSDQLAVQEYLKQKYFQIGGGNSVTYQWQFDGTNIAGATNATLTLTNAKTSDAGTYSVTVTDPAGSTTSSNAVLTTLIPAMITNSPNSQTVVAGTTVLFSAGASGTPPLSYQWQFDGTNIAGATNTLMTITNAVVANAGSYAMVAVNPYGSSTSLVATLVVDESTIRVASTSAAGGGMVVVPVDLIALGTESGLGFSLDFDPSVLIFAGVTLGSSAAGGALEVNTNQVASGRLGLGAALFSGAFSTGTNDVFDVTFQIATVTNATITRLGFGNQPTGEQVSASLPQALPAIYVAGDIIISPTALEGDVWPRPNGNEAVDITDWIQEGRFVAGLDAVTNVSEFQRADCAPRSTLGDGQITVADWVQVGRYAVGLDPLTGAGGPSAPEPQIRESTHPGKDGGSPSVTLVAVTEGAEANSVSVELSADGSVSAVGFSVGFDPALVRFVNATLGSGAAGAAFIQNTNHADIGSLGFVVGLLAPSAFPSGTQQLVNMIFAPVSYSNTTSLVFGDIPVTRQVVNSNTTVLSASFVNANLAVGGLAWPSLSINQAGANIVVTWPSEASMMSLQSSASLEGPWSDVLATPTTVGTSLVLTTPVSPATVYYRLKY